MVPPAPPKAFAPAFPVESLLKFTPPRGELRGARVQAPAPERGVEHAETLLFLLFPDMAKRIANLLRVVLSLQHAPEPVSDSTPDLQRVPLRLLAPHIGRLPMPEDYALEELRNLTQSYLRELTVVTH